MKKLSISLVTLLLVSACGGGVDGDSSETATPEVTSEITPQPEIQVQGAVFTSPATLQTETNFTDRFVSNNTANIAWAGITINSHSRVDYIAQAFNIARAKDPTVKEKIRMPLQAVWDSYTTSEKVIYLINSERSARGMRPFRGIAPELVTSSSLYANELSSNGRFSHTYGIYPSTTARLASWANVIAPSQTAAPTGNENTTYNTFFVEEMIAFIETHSNSTIYEPEARAIYRFMYEDKSPTLGGAYSHRKTILIKNPVAALLPAGVTSTNARPIIGASDAEDMVAGNKRNTLVIHGIDPNSNWNLSNITTPPGLIGPESATDCLSGSFIQSNDSAGNNTSVCR